MTYPGFAVAGLDDPLAGLVRPSGDPTAVARAANTFLAAGQELTNVAARLRASVGGVVGGSWLGFAGMSCQQSAAVLAEAKEAPSRHKDGRGTPIGRTAPNT